MLLHCKATTEDEGRRAVDVLIRHLGISHLLGKKIRLYGSLSVDGTFHRMIDPVHAGNELVAEYTAENEMPTGARCTPCHGIKIIYEDDWLVVADKPPHLLTHPAQDGQVDSLITYLSGYRLHPVSRLDRGTSGLVVLAKNGHSHYRLGHSDTQKEYLGLVYGGWDPALFEQGHDDEGWLRIDLPIARAPGSIILREVSPDGDRALTLVRPERCWSLKNEKKIAATLTRFRLETGRTHQIRVHCRHTGHPMAGDGLYGLSTCDMRLRLLYGPLEDRLGPILGRQALHACSLRFPHPLTGEELVFTSELREDIAEAIRVLDELSPSQRG